ncbi:molybdenum cofactor biosynthesis protein MoaE [soil metagenome]
MTAVGRLTNEPIDASSLAVEAGSPSFGAILVFLGVVRDINDGRSVTAIDYSAYEAMAATLLGDIAREGAERHGPANVVIVHRLGELGLQEASVGIAVANAHRDDAYQLSRWCIDELKRRVPIWKREHYTDGTREWVDPAGAAVEASR